MWIWDSLKGDHINGVMTARSSSFFIYSAAYLSSCSKRNAGKSEGIVEGLHGFVPNKLG